MLPKRIALIALAALIVFALAPVTASAHHGAAPADDFTVVCFPHTSSRIEFRDTWGARRSGGRRHKGTDILSPRGTGVRAVADGTVVFMGEQRLSGYTIKIEHADGWKTTYMHLNNDTLGTDDGQGGPETAFAHGLAVGDIVEAGRLIGFVGDSGNAEHTTTHTHFELTHDGTKLNPYPYLDAAWRARKDLSGSGGESTAWLAARGQLRRPLEDPVEHLLCEPAGERVLLARVIRGQDDAAVRR